jgi:hypothetical protein
VDTGCLEIVSGRSPLRIGPLFPTADGFPLLSPVSCGITQGFTNTAIAEKLFLSPKTIRNQVSDIYSKLQVATRSEAIIKAREAGLGNETT